MPFQVVREKEFLSNGAFDRLGCRYAKKISSKLMLTKSEAISEIAKSKGFKEEDVVITD